MTRGTLATKVGVVVAALALGLALAGCSGAGSTGGSMAPAPVVPEPPDLGSPLSAVDSYADWIAYAYRVLDSDVATHAFSVWEEVNVNSYVQFLKTEKLQAIDQRLVDSDYRLVSEEATKATVIGSEKWRYRYVDMKTGKYAGPELEASYEVTYAVVVEQPKGWVVDHVDAVSRTEVK